MHTDPISGVPVLNGDDPGSEIDNYTQAMRDVMRHLPYRMAAGAEDLSTDGPELLARDVTFPEGRFTVPPIVTVSARHSEFGATVNGLTRDGFRLTARRYDGEPHQGATIDATWQAVQMTPTSAEG